MKKRNGFTLVELLAVIAILAILVIIALPNVMGMFNEAKKNSFNTELKEIYKVAEQTWIMDSMTSTGNQVYTRCKTCTGKSLDLTGRSELEYYVEIDKSGKVTKFYATDGTYQFGYDEGNLLATAINNIEPISELEEDEIIQIENDEVSGGQYSVTLICPLGKYLDNDTGSCEKCPTDHTCDGSSEPQPCPSGEGSKNGIICEPKYTVNPPRPNY